MPRGPRIDIPGLIYHIICRGIERRDIFRGARDYDHLLNRIATLAEEENIAIYAFALMPNHIHLLVRPLSMSLTTFMHRLLTGYAVYFNRRYKRSGHFFQNRYKSFVVEEDRYFLESIRYVHLNPLRADIVKDLEALCMWPYAGHAALMGKTEPLFLKTDEVLSYFAQSRTAARKKLNKFMRDGIAMGRRDDLLGGGVKRSIAKDPHSLSSGQQAADERILGSGEFVQALLSKLNEQNHILTHDICLEQILQSVATHYGITIQELCSGGRRTIIVKARTSAIWLAIRYLTIKSSTLAKTLNVSACAVCRVLKSGRDKEESKAVALNEKFNK